MYQTRAFRRHALCPKTNTVDRGQPGLYELNWSPLTHPERQIMRHIANKADALEVDGKTFLLVPVTRRQLDALAEFEAEFEDRELDLVDGEDDDPKEEDDDCGQNIAMHLFPPT